MIGESAVLFVAMAVGFTWLDRRNTPRCLRPPYLADLVPNVLLLVVYFLGLFLVTAAGLDGVLAVAAAVALSFFVFKGLASYLPRSR